MIVDVVVVVVAVVVGVGVVVEYGDVCCFSGGVFVYDVGNSTAVVVYYC